MNKVISLCIGLLGVLVNSLQAQNLSAPYSEVKGKVVISQFQSLDKPTTEEGIFLNALLWTIENRVVREEDDEVPMIEVDYDKRQFALGTLQVNPKTGSLYRYLFSVKVSDNIITMLASDITYEAETAVIKLVKRLPFEKLQPEKKPKHKIYLDEFAILRQSACQRMLEAVSANEPPVITHWREIKEKNIVKGMTEAECILSLGKPASVQKKDGKAEWMYDSYTYLFFENGVLSSFIR